MKLKLSAILCCICLLGTASYAAEYHEAVTDLSQDINTAGDYKKNWIINRDTDATISYESIQHDKNIYISHASLRGQSSFNLEIASIEIAGGATLSSEKGNITLGNAQVNTIQINAKQGDITINGNVQAAQADGSYFAISSDGSSKGNIILNGATLTNIALENIYFDANWNIVPGGKIEINGNTTLTNVFFKAESVDVADGSNLTLQDIIFCNREDYINEYKPYTGLTLGDNVTLTLQGDTPLSVKDLTLGENVNIILTLSEDAFANLVGSTFSIIDAVEGDVDLSTVSFTFTDGSKYMAATVDSNGGDIIVKEAHSIPEPTTATLSLLALAALASRRRRK